MSRLSNYLKLIEERPDFFNNKGKDSIRIITNPIRIQEEESRLIKEFRSQNLTESHGHIGILVDDPYYLIIRDLVEFPDGRIRGYIRFINKASLEGGEAVAILPVYKGKIILLRNFRHATRDWELEIPRGYGENGISAEDNARKELLEETGLSAHKLIRLGILHTDTAVRSSPAILFYAEIIKLKEFDLETEEVISNIILFSQTQFENMIKQGNIKDAFSISAYSMAKFEGLIK